MIQCQTNADEGPIFLYMSNEDSTDDIPLLKDPSQSINILRRKIGHIPVNVAQTPYGNADSPFHGLIFVKPYVQPMVANDLIEILKQQTNIAYYMQSQDGNVTKEFRPLIGDIPLDLPFAQKLLGDADAVNLWIGNSQTTSRLHNDNYENLFVQITGAKVIYLIPPGDAYALDEKFLVSATYVKDSSQFRIEIDSSQTVLPADITPQALNAALEQIDHLGPKVLFPTVDPSDPITHNHIFKQHAKVYRVQVEAGDVLYIPALWYHQVEISDKEPISISVNYWYPADPASPIWSKSDYVRFTSAVLRGYHDDDFFADD